MLILIDDLRFRLNITVSVGNQTIMSFDRETIFYCTMDLRSVNTKFDNPELEISTVEFQAHYPDAEQAIEQFLGKATKIKVNDREFYSTLTTDNIRVNRDTVTIRGVDGTSFVEGQYPGGLLEHPTNTNYMPIDTYAKDIVKDRSFKIYDFNNTRWGTQAASNPDLAKYLLMEPKSYRKRIANFMNIFRGQLSWSLYDAGVPRFVYRDAGYPLFLWIEPRGSASALSVGNLSWTEKLGMKEFTISYNEVAELTTEYGNVVKDVKIENPYVVIGNTVRNLNPRDILPGQEIFIDLDTPVLLNGVSGTVGTYTATQLSPYTIKVTRTDSLSGTGSVTVRVRDINRIYTAANSNPASISSGLSDGGTITLEPLCGLAQFSATAWPVRQAIEKALTDCNLKRPKWITFKAYSRLSYDDSSNITNCQPRDFIYFTEKGGEKNVYEVDNVLIEYKEGGVVVTVKAIYKCPYPY